MKEHSTQLHCIHYCFLTTLEASDRCCAENILASFWDGWLVRILVKLTAISKSFANEGKLQEELNESKYANERCEINQNIYEEPEFRIKNGFETEPLIMCFFESFQKNNIDETLLHHQIFDNAIAIN